MRFALSLFCFFSLTYAVPLSFSIATEKWGQFDLRKGDRFDYEIIGSKGDSKAEAVIYFGPNDVGNHVFEIVDGGQEIRTPFGAWMSGKDTHTDSHSGTTSPNMQAGSSWRHSYDVYNNSWNSFQFKRVRDCKVIGDESKTVPAGTFDTVHVKCTGQRVDRKSGLNENIWYDTRTGQPVLVLIDWESEGLPYSWSRKLTKMQLVDR